MPNLSYLSNMIDDLYELLDTGRHLKTGEHLFLAEHGRVILEQIFEHYDRLHHYMHNEVFIYKRLHKSRYLERLDKLEQLLYRRKSNFSFLKRIENYVSTTYKSLQYLYLKEMGIQT